MWVWLRCERVWVWPRCVGGCGCGQFGVGADEPRWMTGCVHGYLSLP